MSAPFRIEWSWQARPKPRAFSDQTFVDASEVYIGLRQLLAAREGPFTLHFGDVTVEMQMDPDLSIVFEDLPAVLAWVESAEGPAPSLYFAEQGTDLKVVLERQGDDLAVRLQKGYSAGRTTVGLPDAAPTISAVEFHEQWSAFLRDVLAQIVAVRPGVKEDESYEEYEAALSPPD